MLTDLLSMFARPCICRRWTSMPAFSASAFVPTIVLERPLYVRERNDGLYRAITYLCSKVRPPLP